MLDVHGHNSSARQKHSPVSGTSLDHWLEQQLGVSHLKVKSKLRGNNLYLLLEVLEGLPCPDSASIMPQLSEALSAAAIAYRLPPQSSPVYKVIVYGRLTQQSKPEWTETFVPHLDERSALPRSVSAPRSLSEVAGFTAQECNIEASAGLSVLGTARLGQPEGIARYLSDTFSTLGIAVRVRLEPQKTSSSPLSPLPSPLPSPPSQRLFVVCESAYSPDPFLFAEPIAEHLRALELKGFQDAIVFGQVAGEARPEWVLRVDLTPPDDILKDWARWGDVQALTRLLNRILLPARVQTSAILKEATLHLTCRGMQSSVPDKLTTIAAIAPLLEALSPQGIGAVTLYGFANQDGENASAKGLSTSATPAPAWVHWLDLSTGLQPIATLDLAQQGHLDAIAFLLTRMLNPDLDRTLASGGIRVQVRQKADLLHIMGEAPTCPLQNQMGTAIARFLKPLQIPTIAGVRIYGRRSGQKQPLWSYGVDFHSRDRLVPEATPDFAVSDAYVGDLLSPPGALVLRTPSSDVSQSFLGDLLESILQRVQRSLVWSQLFIPLDSAHLSAPLTHSHSLPELTAQRGAKVAAVWGAIGVLLVVQSDWLLSRWLRPALIASSQPSPALVPSPQLPSPQPPSTQPSASPFGTVSLKQNKSGDQTAFNASGFTQSGTTTSSQPPVENAVSDQLSSPTVLPASPLRPRAESLTKSSEGYPTFNSRQLDEKLALYQSYLREYGTPDVLIIGSSRALRGVDPSALQKALADQGYAGIKIFNFGVNGATAQVVDAIVRQLLPTDKLPKLILWADGARAFNSGRPDITYNGMVASDGYRTLTAGKTPLPGTAVAQVAGDAKRAESTSETSVTEEPPTSLSGGYQTVNQELNRRLGALSTLYTQRDQLKTRLRDELVSLLPQNASGIAFGSAIASNNLSDATSPGAAAANAPASILSEGQSAIDIDGFLPLANRFNPATYYQKYARVNGDYDSDYDSFNLEGSQTQALTNLVQFSQTHQIPLVFVNLPLTNDYLDPTRKRHEEDFQQHMLSLATQLGFVYRDLNQLLVSQPDYFSDPSHLNRYGAYEVSRRLAIDVMIPWNQARK